MEVTQERRHIILLLTVSLLVMPWLAHANITAAQQCPCSLWNGTAVPGLITENDPGAVELGVKFRATVDGAISGLRFYKGPQNTGTHTGSLWTPAGQLLARATFTGESSSGWQQVSFSAPVAITANTVYVASYHTTSGYYSQNTGYFTSSGWSNGPLRALQDGESGGNGVYRYGGAPAFPDQTWNAANYWVDVVFTTSGTPPVDTTPPAVTSTLPANGATGISAGTSVSAIFNEPINAATVTTDTFRLRDSASALVTASVSYDAVARAATLVPASALASSTTYTATLTGGASGIKDLAGNPLAADRSWTFTTGTVADPCAGSPNDIVAENCLPGNPPSEWDITGNGDLSIQGFATDISVNRGQTIRFKIKTNAQNYRIDIYRLGYYGGNGARRVATVQPSANLPQNQPNCLTSSSTGLIDCGNWAESASWAVPSNAVSGVYIARPVRADTSGASHMTFVVRDDSGGSDLLFQTSDATWQGYNDYGGNSLYKGNTSYPAGRAVKVSYNRPFLTRGNSAEDGLFSGEYPMIRWLERNGYDVSYFTDVDSDRFGSEIQEHKVFMSVGHDEYWSAGQRNNVEAARNAGVNLAFFSGNEVYWKTRWEPSIDSSASAYRTLVTYKEGTAGEFTCGSKCDPAPVWTGLWRSGAAYDAGRPENGLTGQISWYELTSSIEVPAADGKLRFWRNTSVATLQPGQVATLPSGMLGYEWNYEQSEFAASNAPGRFTVSSTTRDGRTHKLSLYRHSSGALVFGAGTVQWAWGLDSVHDRGSAAADSRVQQATVNLLADMGVQPASLQAGLAQATASTDTTRPASTITSPSNGASIPAGSAVTISGSATDVGGVVAGVEISVDGGSTWQAATGRASWSFSWTTPSSGTINIKSRAVDDSGNIEQPTAGVSITIGSGPPSGSCPCSLWSSSTVPAKITENDPSAVELGVKFRANVNGQITGIRFYKGPQNTGTHTASLWTTGGQLLARATFTGETSSGWQQVNFSSPVAITANTVYIASYHTTSGNYSADESYFASTGRDNGPLQGLRDGVSGRNGVYRYSAAPIFPNQSWRSSNYWVDVVFTTQ